MALRQPLNRIYRVRFQRLSRVRRVLGYKGDSNVWSDAVKVVVDDTWMIVDIVINWAADGITGATENHQVPPHPKDQAANGLVLCFLHAQVCLTLGAFSVRTRH